MSYIMGKPATSWTWQGSTRGATACMDFEDRHGRKVSCKMSCIPVRLCGFPGKGLVPVAMYGFGAEPMLPLSNLRMQEKKQLCHTVAKVYVPDALADRGIFPV